MNAEEAIKIIIRPYVTEKTFAQVENEQKICFIVKRDATKMMIKNAIKALYNENSININTARTVYGKKAFVQFETVEKARDLATKIGML